MGEAGKKRWRKKTRIGSRGNRKDERIKRMEFEVKREAERRENGNKIERVWKQKRRNTK
jgi:hypothetical protein